VKDYYKILELDVSATLTDIKKAYRRLAQVYHPDKNQEDPYAAAQFAEIKEAYEVLTNPQKKEYYLEQRWFQQSMGRKKTSDVITPVTVLKTTLEFDRHVSKMDVHRMDKEGMFNHVTKELLSDEVITQLNRFDEKDTNDQIISFILKNLAVIPSHRLQTLQGILEKIHSTDKNRYNIKETITRYMKAQEREKYTPLVILGIVVVISLLIYFVSKN
jgi:hypothetical protein